MPVDLILSGVVDRCWGATPAPRWSDVELTAGRQARARATRRAVLVAAASLIDEHGYHGTSLNDVAAVAGTTKGAVYFHFDSKQAVGQALITLAESAWRELLGRITALGHDPLSTVLIIYDAYAGGLMHDVIARAAMRVARDTHVARDTESASGWTKTVGDLLARAGTDGLLHPHIDPARLDRHLLATATGHFHLAAAFPDGPSMWDRMNDTWEGLLPAVASSDWVRRWGSSDWAARPIPAAADYARLDLPGRSR